MMMHCTEKEEKKNLQQINNLLWAKPLLCSKFHGICNLSILG